MDLISSLLASTGFDPMTFLKAAAILAVGALLLGCLGRVVFGKRSNLNHAISSAVGILFIYVVTIVIIGFGAELERFRGLIAPLPFIQITGEDLTIFSFEGAKFSAICSQILSMVILAFLVNLLDEILPRGKNLLTWFLFRCCTVLLAMAAHVLVTGLITAYLPDVIVDYAPMVLLALLVVMLAVGALKIVVGAAIATVNPIIGALYTFFFASFVGKELSKAVLTTALLTALVWGLGQIGVTAISIAPAALVAYVPFLAVLLVLWYVVNMIL